MSVIFVVIHYAILHFLLQGGQKAKRSIANYYILTNKKLQKKCVANENFSQLIKQKMNG
jgi:hypothetical protein